jgi:hypothetical protein
MILIFYIIKGIITIVSIHKGGSNMNHKTSNPTSANYDKNIKNKANEKTPYGENEPSTRPTHK